MKPKRIIIYTHTQLISIRERWVTFKRIVLIALQKLHSQYKERHDIFSKFKKINKKIWATSTYAYFLVSTNDQTWEYVIKFLQGEYIYLLESHA